MMMLGGLLELRLGDSDGAEAMFREIYKTRHPEYAVQAMLRLGRLLERADDIEGAQEAYDQAADAAPFGRRGSALYQVAAMLQRRADITAAKAILSQIVDAETDEGSPEPALIELVNLLGHEGDLDGLRTAYQSAADHHVNNAPYALVMVGNILRDSGDLADWREAWREAISAGYSDAGDLLNEMQSEM